MKEKIVSIKGTKMKIAMVMLLLAFILPQTTFALCNCIPSVWYNPVSWLPQCDNCPPPADVSANGVGTGSGNAANNGLSYGGNGVGGLFDLAQGFLTRALVLLISLAVVWFVYNVFEYSIRTGDAENRDEAKKRMVWGIVAIFVMVSIWGLVAILQKTFNVSPSGSGPTINGVIPHFNFPQ